MSQHKKEIRKKIKEQPFYDHYKIPDTGVLKAVDRVSMSSAIRLRRYFLLYISITVILVYDNDHLNNFHSRGYI